MENNNDLVADIENITKDFAVCMETLKNMNLEKMPAELTLNLLIEAAHVLGAMKKFNDAAKKAIVISSALGRY